jgi:hypothetical protein
MAMVPNGRCSIAREKVVGSQVPVVGNSECMVASPLANMIWNILHDLMAGISQGSRKTSFYMMLETYHSSNAYNEGKKPRKISKPLP